jgi:hypothetical protein
MFGEPIPMKAEALGVVREIERMVQRRCSVAALCDRRKVEDGPNGPEGFEPV